MTLFFETNKKKGRTWSFENDDDFEKVVSDATYGELLTQDTFSSDADVDPIDTFSGRNKTERNTGEIFNRKQKELPVLSILDVSAKIYACLTGDKVCTDFGRDLTTEVALKTIPIPEKSKALVLNAGNGSMGILLAARNPMASIYLYDDDESNTRLIERNLDANMDTMETLPICNAFCVAGNTLGSEYDVVILRPPSHVGLDAIRDYILTAYASLKIGGKLYVVTHNKSGAPRHAKIVSEVFGSEQFSHIFTGRGGYRVFAAERIVSDQDLVQSLSAPQVPVSIFGLESNYQTEHGLFSKNNLDLGSRYLLETVLPIFKNNDDTPKKILDAGCGWGVIGCTAAQYFPAAQVDLIDSSRRAIDVAEQNVQKLGLSERVQVLNAGNIKEDIAGKYDLILSNPPYHLDIPVLLDFFIGIRSKLENKGKCFCVIEQSFQTKFIGIFERVFGRFTIYSTTTVDNISYTIIQLRK